MALLMHIDVTGECVDYHPLLKAIGIRSNYYDMKWTPSLTVDALINCQIVNGQTGVENWSFIDRREFRNSRNVCPLLKYQPSIILWSSQGHLTHSNVWSSMSIMVAWLCELDTYIPDNS